MADQTTDWDGCPENPERDGLHWLRRAHRDHDTLHRWIAADKVWRGGGDDFGPDWAARHWRYLGRVITPAEVDAKDAEIERLRAALRVIAGEAPASDNLLGNADIARIALHG